MPEAAARPQGSRECGLSPTIDLHPVHRLRLLEAPGVWPELAAMALAALVWLRVPAAMPLRTGGGNARVCDVAGAMKRMSSSCWWAERGAATECKARREFGFHFQLSGAAVSMARGGSGSRAALGGKWSKGEDFRRSGKSNSRYW